MVPIVRDCTTLSSWPDIAQACLVSGQQPYVETHFDPRTHLIGASIGGRSGGSTCRCPLLGTTTRSGCSWDTQWPAAVPASNAVPPRGMLGNHAAADEPGCCASKRPCSLHDPTPSQSRVSRTTDGCSEPEIDLRQEHTSIPANNTPTIIRGELSVGAQGTD